jgi:hypothetical protein
MKRFVEGEDRRQGVLLPEFLDDYVGEDNPVRTIDVFVDELDLRGLGFSGVVPEVTREALARSNAQGARTVDLTSRSSREDANRLYQHLGFQRRDSNVYRFSLG